MSDFKLGQFLAIYLIPLSDMYFKLDKSMPIKL